MKTIKSLKDCTDILVSIPTGCHIAWYVYGSKKIQIGHETITHKEDGFYRDWYRYSNSWQNSVPIKMTTMEAGRHVYGNRKNINRQGIQVLDNGKEF